MIVPQFWAEARVHRLRSKNQKQITVLRFGWSDKNQEEAEQMAQQRAQEALQRIISGKIVLPRREPKIPYNGAEGVPIREEVLSRHGEIVITRNSYGAHCLNTPDVLFADVDYEIEPRFRFVVMMFVFLLSIAVLCSVWLRSSTLVVVSAWIAFVLWYPLAVFWHKRVLSLRGGPERLAKTRVTAFVRRHPDWHLRIYQTPAGFRILVLHRTFKPDEPAVNDFFAALAVDPVYARMCRNQQCFRARVSPKPWRMGLSRHMRPRPGVWPVKAEHLEVRNAWIRDYESAATRFASCKFIEALGNSFTDPKAAKVRDLHDRMSQALSGREIA